MSLKRHVVFSKTIRCFLQNDTLFSPKRHVVFSKTTRCFLQNEPLFFPKRAVVFSKTIRRFAMRYNTKFEEGLFFLRDAPKKKNPTVLRRVGYYLFCSERAGNYALPSGRPKGVAVRPTPSGTSAASGATPSWMVPNCCSKFTTFS